MGKIALYADPYASYYYFRDLILNRSSETYIYLLPLNRAVRYLKRDLIRNSAQGALFDPLIFTFNSLMKYLNQKMPHGKKIITEPMKMVLLQDLINQKTHQFESIRPAKSVKGVSNLIRRLNLMLNELTHFGYQSGSFTDPPPGAETKYQDFALLMQRLQESFRDELTDETGIFAEIIAAIDEQWMKQTFPRLERLYVSGYGIYTPLMLRFIKHMKTWVDIDISLVYSKKNPHLFRHARNAFDAISKMADHVQCKEPNISGFDNILFNQQISNPQKIKNDAAIHIQGARNIREELSYIAFKIKELHHTQGIPLHLIGVTFPNPESYAPLLRIIFSEYKIPFNMSTGFSLAQSPLIQTFLSCLKIVRENFRVKSILDLLSSPLIKNDFRAETADLAGILQKNRQASFTENWHEQLEELKLEKRFTDSAEEEMDYEGSINLVNHTVQTLKKLNRKKSPAEFQSALLDCLSELGILSWFEHSRATLSRSAKEREFRAFNQFIKLLNQMIWILQYKDPGRKYSLGEYEIYLREIVQNAVYNVKEWPEYGVQVMPRLEIQSVDLSVLFIGGLIEGVFPRKFVKDIFFNDTERESMGLNASEDLRDQDRFLFYQLLTITNGPIYLTFPYYNNETKQIRSSFLDNLSEICHVTDSKNVLPEQLINERNILIYAGKNVFDKTQNEWLSLLKWVPADNKKFWFETLEDQYRIFDRTMISNFEGNLTSNNDVLNYLKKKIPEMIFSVTALESYLFCPMQYFLQRIVQVEADEEEEELLTAREKGILIHRILFRFFSALRSKNMHSEPWKNEDLLIRIAREEFKNLPFTGFLWDLEQENYFGTMSGKGLWHVFLEKERSEIQANGFFPGYFEMGFGLKAQKDEQDALSTRNPFLLVRNGRKIQLSGKVDRIDVDKSGRFLVIDYKTGSGAGSMTRNEIESGKALQLPVYLEAVIRRFSEKRIGSGPAGAVYYFLGDAEKLRRKVVLNETNRADVWQRAEETVFKIMADLENGHFNHTDKPDDVRCSRYCTFARICRKDRSKLIARRNQA